MSIQSNFPAIAPSLLLDFANTKQLDNRITFTRSTPAVYYDGKTTAMAEQNTVLYSQDIANGYWTKYQVSLSSATAPDGTSTASTLTEAITDNNHAIWTTAGPIVTTTGISSTFSIYAKAGTCSTFGIQIYRTGVGFFIDFDLTTVASNIRSGTGTSSITAVGGGWYRCTATSSALGSNTWQFEVYMTLTYGGVSSYLGTGRTLSVWGVQAEQRNAVTAYTATTTQPITNYIPVLLSAGGNQARFDHNPTTGESLGLLIEEGRTNVIIYSANPSNAAWIKAGASITSSTVVAPDGTLSGAKSVEDTALSTHGIYQQITLSANTNYTWSIYLKKAERTRVQFYAQTSTVEGAIFDLATGTISNITAGVSASMYLVGNDWYRCSLTRITTVSDSSGFLNIFSIEGSSGSNAGYTGNGFSGFYLWGGQVEAGSFATSYIATTSASATRTADVTQMTGANFSSWFNNAQGTFVAIVSAGVLSNGARICKVSDTDANRLIDFFVSGTSQGIFSYQNGITSANFSSGTIGTTKYLTSVSYLTGNISGVVNGGTVTTSTSAVVSSVANSTFAIGYDPITGAQLSRPIAKIAYYPIQVTSANLQALTS